MKACMRLSFILSFFIILLCGFSSFIHPIHASPFYEDLENDYVTVGTHTTFISSTQAKANPYDRDVDEYVYSDEGTDYFGDFQFVFDMFWNGDSHNSASVLYFCMLSNDLDDGFNLANGIGIRAEEYSSKVQYSLFEVGGDTDTTGWITYHIWYFCVLERSGTDFSLEIYSSSCVRDVGGSGDVSSLSIVDAGTAYRYVYTVSSHNSGHSARDAYGNIRNLDLQREPSEFVTFYHNVGGVLKVDGVTVANGSEIAYLNESVIELAGVVQGNLTYGVSNFTWGVSSNVSNAYNFTVTSNVTVWCYFEPFELVLVPDDSFNWFPFVVIMGVCCFLMFVVIVAKP